MRYRAFLLILLIPSTPGWSQSAAGESRKWRVNPLPVIYYSPETRLGFGGFLAGTVNLGQDSATTTSYVQTSFIYTLNKQYEASTIGRLYSPGNERIFQYRFYYAHFPEYFYGYQTEKPDQFEDLIEFNRAWVELRHFWSIGKNVYAGIFGRLHALHQVKAEPMGSFMNEKPPGFEGYTLLGIAPAFSIDRRDNLVYPRKGFFLETMWVAHPGVINDFVFGNFRLDLRYYRPLNFLFDDVVAFQFFANLNEGTVPFRDMGDVGGPNVMRGYYRGYYRYKNLLAIQAEYRFLINRIIGFASWAGVGATSESWKDPFANALKPNGGIGLRFRINPKDKLNIRADYGFGKRQSGFYLDAAEAF